MMTETIGNMLKRQRELRGMSVAEVSRITRIPERSVESIDGDRFDDLPGETFVRGFLKSYAQAVGLVPADVLARYTSSRRASLLTDLPTPAFPAAHAAPSKRFGVAIAFVLLLILVTVALSIVLRPRGRGVPVELSQGKAPSSLHSLS